MSTYREKQRLFGRAVDKQYRKFAKIFRPNLVSYRHAIDREAARVWLFSEPDRNRLRRVPNRVGWEEFNYKSNQIVEELANTMSKIGIPIRDRGLIKGIGLFTGGLIFNNPQLVSQGMFTLGVGLFGGTLSMTAKEIKQHSYSKELEAKEEALNKTSRLINQAYSNAEDVLDCFLGTDLVIKTASGECFAVDVYAGASKDSFHKKKEMISNYCLEEVFYDENWIGHCVWWHRSKELPSKQDLDNFIARTINSYHYDVLMDDIVFGKCIE
ncbi:hypothetical protein VZH09_11675 [Synechococcus elongatus IITB7]|uniref:hypothetical protein n=1 Tax=Synechococcus elongatus TaxID=32046 RepID=UPI0030D1EA74